MAPETKKRLIEDVAEAIWNAVPPWDEPPGHEHLFFDAPESERDQTYAEAMAAIALIEARVRAEALEEAAVFIERTPRVMPDRLDVAKEIRALKVRMRP
jgi:hypothetical protein